MLNLAKEYYDQGDDRQAVATAIYGMSTYKALEPSFRTILGCSVLNLGFYSEAGFHLKKASGLEALKGKCLARLQDLRSRL
jgi:hypothetical protein